MAEKRERDVSLDLARVIAMIFVIAVHTETKPFEYNFYVREFTYMLLLTCNPIFFMISGLLNLRKSFGSKEDILAFYGKKLVGIVFPFFIVGTLLYFHNTLSAGNAPSLLDFHRTFMHGFSTGHLWFVYALIGLLLSTPILAKAFQNMSNGELNVVFAVCLAWNFVCYYLSESFGITFSYHTWVMSGWATAYFAGYYCSRVINDKNRKTVYLLGLAGFIVNIVSARLISGYANGPDLAAPFLVFAFALFVFITNELKVKRAGTKKVITFLSRHSFTVYMLHMLVLEELTPHFIPDFTLEPFNIKKAVVFLMYVVITLVLCIVMAAALDYLVIFPGQKLLLKLGKKNKNAGADAA